MTVQERVQSFLQDAGYYAEFREIDGLTQVFTIKAILLWLGTPAGKFGGVPAVKMIVDMGLDWSDLCDIIAVVSASGILSRPDPDRVLAQVVADWTDAGKPMTGDIGATRALLTELSA